MIASHLYLTCSSTPTLRAGQLNVRLHPMRTYTFGESSSFAMELQSPRVNIFIAGRRITDEDDKPYMQALVGRLDGTAKFLRERLNFLQHESLFNDLSVEDGYRALASQESDALEDAFRANRFADWGPITDSSLTFLIPKLGRLYLATAPVGGGEIAAVQVFPYDLVSTIRQVLEHLSVGKLSTGLPPYAV